LVSFDVLSNRGFAIVTLSERVRSYYREARWRARRRKSAWNILLSLFCIGSGLALWYALFRLVRATPRFTPIIALANFGSPGSARAVLRLVS